MTEDQLKWGYWWVTHKLLLKKILTAIIGVVAGILVLYAGYGFVDWFLLSGVAERSQVATMANRPTGYQFFNDRTAPVQLQVDSPQVLTSGSGSYDLVSGVTNGNADWRAELGWRFVSNGQPLGKLRNTTVLPGSHIYLMQLGYKADSLPVGVDISIESMRWVRTDKHQVRPDYAAWAGERLDLRFDNIEFTPSATDDLLQVSRANFTVNNATGYGYWRVGFFVTLWNGSSLVGVNYVTVGELKAGETRPVDASWFTGLPRVTRVEVSPELNIFDTGIYMPVRN